MERPILSDKDVFPTDEIIFSHIGKTKKFWSSLFKEIHTKYPGFNEQWQFYNDGKSWLLKITKKSKTIFWVSVFKDSFKTTFYFGNKAEQTIMTSEINDKLKDQFINGQRFGKIRGITISPSSQNDVKDVISLIELKLKIK